MPRYLRWGLLSLLAVCTARVSGQPTATVADQLRTTHDALFASFLPVEELRDRPEIAQLFMKTRDAIWFTTSGAPAFRDLVLPFSDLRSFGEQCGMAEFLRKQQSVTFSDLDSENRQRILSMLGTCSSNEARRKVMMVRNFYVGNVYRSLQETLTGVSLNLYASDEFVASHQLKLPPTRLRYDSKSKQIRFEDGEIDYLIVGSGPAGSVLAHELRRNGKRVVLVERGSFVVPGSMETRLIDDLLESGGTRTSVDGAIYTRSGMGVGGGSLVNVDLAFAPTLPSVQAKIALWKQAGRIPPSDFTTAEVANAYRWVKATLGTRTLSESEINPNNRVLWDGAKLAGLHPKLYDLNTYAPGQSPYPITDKRSAETELILKAMGDNDNPLALVPDADVQRVLFEPKGNSLRVRGVEIRMRRALQKNGVIADPNGFRIPAGELVTIRARRVILSAGALGSPTILLRSKIPNDQIGRGAILHPSMPLVGLFDRTIDAMTGTQSSVYDDDFLLADGFALEAMSADPAYAALMSPGGPLHVFDLVRSYRNLAGFGVMLIDTPSPQNRIVLGGDGEPEIEYALSESDKERFRQGITQATRIMFMAGAKEVFLPTTEDLSSHRSDGEMRPVELTSMQEASSAVSRMQFIPNRTILTSAHLQATNKMGASPGDSVVSREFKVWGTDGLFVVDSSVFPTSIGANPMQSIYTFAKIFADRMLAGELAAN